MACEINSRDSGRIRPDHGLQEFNVCRDPRSDPVRGSWTYLVSRDLAEGGFSLPCDPRSDRVLGTSTYIVSHGLAECGQSAGYIVNDGSAGLGGNLTYIVTDDPTQC